MTDLSRYKHIPNCLFGLVRNLLPLMDHELYYFQIVSRFNRNFSPGHPHNRFTNK